KKFHILDRAVRTDNFLQWYAGGIAGAYSGWRAFGPVVASDNLDREVADLCPGELFPLNVSNLRTHPSERELGLASVLDHAGYWMKNRAINLAVLPPAMGITSVIERMVEDPYANHLVVGATPEDYAMHFLIGGAIGIPAAAAALLPRYLAIRSLKRSACYLDGQIEELYR
ncbi:MAG: hypothetical protein HY518_02180, partial [Candidatus Aenigmarchaeota archaeon]|nr:hypothetical protein [Candidatus Aenigmarchaeota archaeon]